MTDPLNNPAGGTPAGRSDGSHSSNAQETERPARPGPASDSIRLVERCIREGVDPWPYVIALWRVWLTEVGVRR